MGAKPQIAEDLALLTVHSKCQSDKVGITVFAKRAHKPTVLSHLWKDTLRAIPDCKLEHYPVTSGPLQCLWGRDHAIGHAWHRHLVIPLSLRAWLTVLGTLTNAGRSGFAEVPLPQPVSCVMLLFLIHIPLGPMHSQHVP